MDSNEEKLLEAALDKYKFVILVIAVPVILALLNRVAIGLLVKSGQKLDDKALQTDAELAKKEAADKQAAQDILDRLNQKAKVPVDENWNHET